MNGSTSIFEFIDGALDQVREQELFDELARHPEMRAELRQYVAIGDAVRADREAYVPPSHVEHELMSGLGLIPIGAVGGSGAAAGAVGLGLLGRVGLFKGFAPLVGSFAAGVLIATGGFIAMFSAGETGPAAAGIRDTIVIREVAQAAAAAAPSIVSQATPTDAKATDFIEPARAVSRPQRVEAVRAHSTQTPTSVSNELLTDARETPAIIADEENGPMANMAAPIGIRLADRTEREPIALDDAGATVSVRGLDQNIESFGPLMDTRESSGAFGAIRSNVWMKPFVDNNARRDNEGIGDELVAGMYVRASESFSAGLEFGQGNYPQVLVYPEDYVANGAAVGQEIARIEQEPSVAWLGVAGRWHLFSISRKLPIWTQLTLGYGFDHGPILNGRAGVDWTLTDRLALTGALETTSLVYFFNGQPLVSAKYGLSLGVQLGM